MTKPPPKEDAAEGVEPIGRGKAPPRLHPGLGHAGRRSVGRSSRAHRLSAEAVLTREAVRLLGAAALGLAPTGRTMAPELAALIGKTALGEGL